MEMLRYRVNVCMLQIRTAIAKHISFSKYGSLMVYHFAQHNEGRSLKQTSYSLTHNCSYIPEILWIVQGRCTTTLLALTSKSKFARCLTFYGTFKLLRVISQC